VIIPDENRKDLADLPKAVTQGLKIIPAKWIDEVLGIALERAPAPAPASGEGEVSVRDGSKPASQPDVKH